MVSQNQERAVGIDLGTTFSAVAYVDPTGRPETLLNAEGQNKTPSAVFFDRDAPVVGVEALRAGRHEPERLAQFAKRDMGELAYNKSIRGELIPPEVIQGIVLKKLKADAEMKLGTVHKAVITVPAFFNEPCRKATQDSGRMAGLEVMDIINEPTAAAISYGFTSGFLSESGQSHELERILVFDLGGGTFDVTIMEIDGAKYKAVATAGDVYLGGYDWDSRIVSYLAEQFEQQFGESVEQDAVAMQSLLEIANEAKHALSARKDMAIYFAHQGKQLRLSLARDKFQDLTKDLVERSMVTVRMALQESSFQWKDITRVLMVGGSTRMPMIEQAVRRECGMQVDRSMSPDEAVAQGAAIYASLLLHSPEATRFGMSLSNINSHDLGVLGIERTTKQQRKHVMIPRNSPLPAEHTHRFTTHAEGQSSVKVAVVEAGDESGQNSITIGKCVISNLPKGLPAGTPVDVKFSYATNGRLTVKAWLPSMDTTSTKLELDRSAGLTDEGIEQWRKRLEDGMPDPGGGEDGIIELDDAEIDIDHSGASDDLALGDDILDISEIEGVVDVSDIEGIIDITDSEGIVEISEIEETEVIQETKEIKDITPLDPEVDDLIQGFDFDK